MKKTQINMDLEALFPDMPAIPASSGGLAPPVPLPDMAFSVVDPAASFREDPNFPGLRVWWLQPTLLELVRLLPSEGNARSAKAGGFPGLVRSILGLGRDDTSGAFLQRHGGLHLFAATVKKNGKGVYILPTNYGLFDGSRSHQSILEAARIGTIPENERVNLFVYEQVPVALLTEMSRAHNTSNNAKSGSLMNLEGWFDALRAAVPQGEYTDRIAWEEHSENDARVPVRYLVRVLQVLHPKSYATGQDMPLNRPLAAWKSAYSTRFVPMLPLVRDIMRLHDALQLAMTLAWDTVYPKKIGPHRGIESIRINREAFGQTRWYRFGKGDNETFEERRRPLSSVLLIPVLAAFRCYLVAQRRDGVCWNPSFEEAVRGIDGVVPSLVDELKKALYANDEQGVALDPDVWQNLTVTVRGYKE